VISSIHEQSADINRGVVRQSEDEQGAGDQGMMFGYATDQTDSFMPPSLEFAHLILRELSDIRREGKKMKYLRPDAKSQVTIEYNDAGKPVRVDTIVISTQHDEFITASDNSPESQQYADERMLEKITIDIEKILLPRVKAQIPRRLKKLFREDYRLFVNPTGKFVIGGPHGDTGLTGRKIIVDTYGGKGAHGGGAFSGKDSSKVDRSAAYAARHIAKNMVAAGVSKEILIQVAYAIGVAQPVGLYVNTYGTAKVRDKQGRKLTDAEISEKVSHIFDMRPAAIVRRLGLKNPIFLPTASYGHFGRDPYTAKVKFLQNGKENEKSVEFFTWEKLDYVDKIKATFEIV
jgi:S-adenosylmethionine synthetase